MKNEILTVIENRALTDSVFIMRLAGAEGENRPGQFVEIRLGGLYLRRPISVCDFENGVLTLVVKNVGKGTGVMSELKNGDELDVLTGLGNGYDISAAGERPLLIGGGVGVPPLMMLAKELVRSGKDVSVVLGFNTEREVFFEKEFRELGCSVCAATADGSYGVKGFVTDALPSGRSYFYACGPRPMLRALCQRTDIPGELSLEERMGCGFGACMGCSVMTAGGAKRVCREGPVFKKEELIW